MPSKYFTSKKTIILFLLCNCYLSLKAQTTVDSMKIKSGWAVSLDLSNFPDNYPAVLFSGERFFNEYFGILLEVGHVC